VTLHHFKAATAKRDMIDDARIRTLVYVRFGNVVEMQHGMTCTIQPRSREIELRARTVHESEHTLVNCTVSFSLRVDTL
jgi:hypothetical protein